MVKCRNGFVFSQHIRERKEIKGSGMCKGKKELHGVGTVKRVKGPWMRGYHAVGKILFFIHALPKFERREPMSHVCYPIVGHGSSAVAKWSCSISTTHFG